MKRKKKQNKDTHSCAGDSGFDCYRPRALLFSSCVCVCVSLDTEVLVLEKLQQNFDLLLHTEASERVKNTIKPAESRTSASAESKTSRQIIHNTHTRRARASEQLNRRV